MQSKLEFKDLPIGVWLVGLIFLGGGLYSFSLQAFSWNTLLLGGIGLALLLLFWGLTITADRERRVLELRYWSLYFLRRTKEIPFADIQSIRLDSTRSSRGGRTYRIELTRRDGSLVPFRVTYSSGSARKQKIVDELRAFIGLEPALDENPLAAIRLASQAAAAAVEQTQEALTGPNEQERLTDGVHWRLQSGSLGASPLTRWFSPDFKMQSGFLFLAQKAGGQGSGKGMGSLGRTLLKQVISMYGFGPGDTPDLELSDSVTPLPALVDYHFTAITSNQDEARQILNPWVQNPLAGWGQKYPLKTFQSKSRFSQLVILFNQDGLTLATLGLLHPDQVDEVTALGVELVKAQGTQ